MTTNLPVVAELDFDVVANTDFRLDFQCVDSENVPVDITGCDATFYAINREFIISKVTADLLIIESDYGPDNGFIQLHLLPADILLLPVGEQTPYQLTLYLPGSSPPGSGDKVPLFIGFINGKAGL